jgi:hypothetical protein
LGLLSATAAPSKKKDHYQERQKRSGALNQAPETVSFDGILPYPRRPLTGLRSTFFGQSLRQLIIVVKQVQRAVQILLQSLRIGGMYG